MSTQAMCLYSQPTQARNPVRRGSPLMAVKRTVRERKIDGISFAPLVALRTSWSMNSSMILVYHTVCYHDSHLWFDPKFLFHFPLHCDTFIEQRVT